MAKHVCVFTNRIIELGDEGMQRWNESIEIQTIYGTNTDKNKTQESK